MLGVFGEGDIFVFSVFLFPLFIFLNVFPLFMKLRSGLLHRLRKKEEMEAVHVVIFGDKLS